MIKVDLITGFLGSGKTTFIKEYAKKCIANGEKVAILENDYGAINVDMMLLEEELGSSCELEMVAGGCDYDCHIRRFKTKLISMGMRGFDRVIIEPSGIFDLDEFFNVIYDDPLPTWYEIDHIIAIVDSHLEKDLSKESLYLLANQCVNAGMIVFSKIDDITNEKVDNVLKQINEAILLFKGKRVLTKDDIIVKSFKDIEVNDFKNKAYLNSGIIKMFVAEDQYYDSLFYMNKDINKDMIDKLMNATNCGYIFRIKGFIKKDDGYDEINVTRDNVYINHMSIGQDVFIIIGENLNKENIDKILFN